MCKFYANGGLDRGKKFSYLGFCKFVTKKTQFTLQVQLVKKSVSHQALEWLADVLGYGSKKESTNFMT